MGHEAKVRLGRQPYHHEKAREEEGYLCDLLLSSESPVDNGLQLGIRHRAIVNRAIHGRQSHACVSFACLLNMAHNRPRQGSHGREGGGKD